MAQPLTEMAKDLTLALIGNNLIAPEDMQKHLHQIHASLCELQAREDRNLGSGEGREAHGGTQPAPKDWRKSIKKRSVECLICGAIFRQLSARHLRQHHLDPRTYRQQFGIPSFQPLSAKETTAMRRRVVQHIRPWEKAPTYGQAHKAAPAARPKQARKKATTTSQS
jgi:predicted transcriptional regulator